MFFCSLKGINPKILCCVFVLINSVFFFFAVCFWTVCVFGSYLSMLREASLGIFFFSTPSAALAALAKASSDEENDTRDD